LVGIVAKKRCRPAPLGGAQDCYQKGGWVW
jgi:hypothetical protein